MNIYFSSGAIGGPEILFLLVPLIIIAFSAAMLIDAIKNKKLSDTAKALWIIGILITYPVAALAYYFAAHSKRS